MTCERCGVEVHVSDWPFCPHGRYGGTVIGDEIPGGFVQENFGHRPEKFYSKKTMMKRAKDLGLINVVKWAGPTDRHLQRWATMDPQTLQNAEALVERVARDGSGGSDPEVVCETYRRVV